VQRLKMLEKVIFVIHAQLSLRPRPIAALPLYPKFPR
jgi:hypothetical protein